jgi:hypothetical protein
MKFWRQGRSHEFV